MLVHLPDQESAHACTVGLDGFLRILEAYAARDLQDKGNNQLLIGPARSAHHAVTCAT
jgi:hypothetical protein